MKLIMRDGKEMYGNFGGHLKEATNDNLEADIEIHRRVLNNIEKSYNENNNEIKRLNRIRQFILDKENAQ